MTAQPVSYAERSFTLAAGASLKYDRQATFVTCLEASGSFKIKLNNSPESDFGAGLQFEPIGGFSTCEIRNPGITPLTVTMGFGIGNMNDNRVTLNSGQTLPVRQGAPDVLTSLYVPVPQNAGTLFAGANSLRRELLIENHTGQPFYVSGDASNTSGVVLDNGQSITLETTAAVYVSQTAYAGNLNVRGLELAWSA